MRSNAAVATPRLAEGASRSTGVAGAPRRVGFAGTGYIAEWHAKALASMPGTKLVAACDKILPRAQTFAERFGVPGAYDSLESMLSAERLDAVHVLLPPDAHFEAARAILAAGAHVLLEKPMCASAAECASLERLASERALQLGVGHNFLFAEPYERLRRDVRDGVLGPIDHLTITWHRELPQAAHGPFDIWMLRDPGHIMLEVGSHAVAYLVDLVGPPTELQVRAENPVVLPTGSAFHRRWRVSGVAGRTAFDLLFSFVPGFSEHAVHARGMLGSAVADLERNTYLLRRHRPLDDDLDRYEMTVGEAREQRRQARATFADWALTKLRLRAKANPYLVSIRRALDAFHHAPAPALDARLSAATGVEVIRACEEIAARGLAGRPAAAAVPAPAPTPMPSRSAGERRVLVLGATGFIGRELLRVLAAEGRAVRLLARSPSKLPRELPRANVEILRGDLSCDGDLRRAMADVDVVCHLARANVKTWAEYQRDEIGVTRAIAEAALACGVRRLVYTGTIDSYYAGARAGVITEDTALDPRIERRNLYARAKAVSERLLLELHRERGLPLVIVRPGIVIGTGGSPFHWGVGMWWHGSVCQIWGDGRNKLPLVLVEDVARGLAAACDVAGIEGESFNLVADPCLTAREYLDELERHGGFRLQRKPVPIARFYAWDLLKWAVKVLVRHPERRLPSYRDWESRTQRAVFDCSRAKERLGWKPVSDRAELVRRGIEGPLRELLR